MKKHYTFKIFVLAFMLSLCGSISAFAQAKPKFEIVSCVEAVGDMTAQTHKKLDGNNKPFAIIKVSSTDPDDDLLAYTFSFGMINNLPPELHDGNLWIYVGQNAKNVTIRRDGYQSIEKMSLPYTVQAGNTYSMKISPGTRAIDKQKVQFEITPPDSKATVMVQSTRPGSKEEKFGEIDANGILSGRLLYGEYNYRIISDMYKEAFGNFVLDNKNVTKEEQISLKPYFATVKFKVDGDASIYVDDIIKGQGQCTLLLKYDYPYNVECRLNNHKPTVQTVMIKSTVTDTTIVLKAPQPITGYISVTSSPKGATVIVDGTKRGITPIDVNIIVGKHTVTVEKENYQSQAFEVEVKADTPADVDAVLTSKGIFTIESFPSGASLHIDGKSEGVTPHTAEMLSGDYKIKISKKGYKPIEQYAHIDVSQKKLSFNMEKRYFKPTGAYIQPGFSIGPLMGASGALGFYISNLNVEAFGTYGITKSTIYGNYDDGSYAIEGSVAPIAVGGRIGYGIMATNRIRITPQVGFMAVTGKADGIAKISTGSASIGARVEYGLSSTISLVAAPQYRTAVLQGDLFKSLSEKISSIKGWSSGFDVLIGISINM